MNLMPGLKKLAKKIASCRKRLPASKPSNRILFFGLQHAGKSTLLKKINASNESSSVTFQKYCPELNSTEQKIDTTSIQYAILAISVDQLNNAQTRQQLIEHWQQIKQPSQLHLSLVITQCDQCPGFTDFFSSIETTDDGNNTKDEKIFALSWNDTLDNDLKALSEQFRHESLARLSSSQTPAKKRAIISFPAAFDALQSDILSLCQSIDRQKNNTLDSIIFTSAAPNENTIQLPYETFGFTPPARTDSTASDATSSQTTSAKATLSGNNDFFIKALPSFLENLVFNARQERSNNSVNKRLAAIICSALLSIASFSLAHYAYDDAETILNQANTLSSPTPSSKDDQSITLDTLGTLDHLSHPLKIKMLRFMGFTAASDLAQAVKEKYTHILHTAFQEHLEDIVTQQMHLALDNNKIALYNALKVYLTASDTNHYNPQTILDWYRSYWLTTFPNDPKRRANNEAHLNDLLQHTKQLWEPDRTLISHARHALRRLSLANIAFLTLQGQYLLQTTALTTHDIPGFSLRDARIPVLFSDKAFDKITKQDIPNIQDLIYSDNWVIHTQHTPPLSQKALSTLKESVQSIYLNYYRTQWETAFQSIHVNHNHSFKTLNESLESILNPQSELHQLLNEILKKATIAQHKPTSNTIKALEQFLQATKSSPISLFSKTLSSSITQLYQQEDMDKASYAIVLAHFIDTSNQDETTNHLLALSQHQAPVFSAWMQTLIKNYRNLLISHTEDYLEHIWTTLVLPAYKKTVQHHYPIFEDANKEINIAQFHAFFGPNGTIGSFFIYYLEPFVNMKTNYWQWKTQDGFTLTFPKKTLDIFIRASLIQKMFYADNHDSPSFSVTLSPVELSKPTTRLLFSLNSVQYDINPRAFTPMIFSWPGDTNQPDVFIRWLDADTNNAMTKTKTGTQIAIKGDWSWFRLLDQSTFKITPNPQQYHLKIQKGSAFARFNVTTPHRVNPMIPGILKKFRCPTHLSGQ